MAVRALIAEDEPLARQTLRDFLAGEDWIEIVGEACDGATAVRLIDELRPDLVFLDVQMPGLTGLQVIERTNHTPQTIFTTAYDEYAVSAFELAALDYLLKPFGRERFRRSLERIKHRLTRLDEPTREHSSLAAALPSRLLVRDGRGRIVPLRVSDISRFVAADDYVEVHANGKSFLIHLTLNNLERRLDSTRFRRVHRSHIINLDHISSIETFDRRLLVYLKDGSEVLASRTGSQSLKDLIL